MVANQTPVRTWTTALPTHEQVTWGEMMQRYDCRYAALDWHHVWGTRFQAGLSQAETTVKAGTNIEQIRLKPIVIHLCLIECFRYPFAARTISRTRKF